MPSCKAILFFWVNILDNYIYYLKILSSIHNTNEIVFFSKINIKKLIPSSKLHLFQEETKPYNSFKGGSFVMNFGH